MLGMDNNADNDEDGELQQTGGGDDDDVQSESITVECKCRVAVVPIEKKDEQETAEVINDTNYLLDPQEEEMLNDMLAKELHGEHPDLSVLSNKQLDKFIAYVLLMKNMLRDRRHCQLISTHSSGYL